MATKFSAIVAAGAISASDKILGVQAGPTDVVYTFTTASAAIASVLGLAITSGKTFTVTNTLTLAGTDGSTLTVGAGGTLTALAFTAPGTGVATALGVNVGSAGAFVTFNGAGGTPSSMTATNLTGTASGLTAGSVTTNANLTGVITSSGNATSITSQTGTGTKFVVDTSPTLVTPILGVAAGTSMALGGATIGSNALAVTGQSSFGGSLVTGTVAAFTHGAAANGTPVAQTVGFENASGTNVAAAATATMFGPLSTGTGAAGTVVFASGFAGITGGATATFTSASPTVVTVTAHGYVPGQVLQFSNAGGALPTGITAATNYYVLATALAVNTFEISLTAGGAAVNTSSTGSGTQTSTPQTTVQNPASTVLTLGPSGLSGSQAISALSLAQTWNTNSNITGILANFTNIASGASSKLIDLQVGGASKFSVDKAGAMNTASSFTAGSFVSATAYAFGASGSINSSSDGVFRLQNNAGTSFGRLQFGGTTSSFAAIKLSGTTLAFRLADDSADAAISSAAITASGSTTYTVATAGVVLKRGANGLCGTFVANGVTPVTVSNTNVAITDAIIISLNTVGGTVGANPPDIQTITAGTGFTVAGLTLDTSTYNYTIIKNAA